mmetsp:Transcript_21020/g.67725  ORF Transcript_21020/g.67725 Transcript_21020/m.67725 type:complete len:201 (+) Transcript_21020:2645-3247(+)
MERDDVVDEVQEILPRVLGVFFADFTRQRPHELVAPGPELLGAPLFKGQHLASSRRRHRHRQHRQQVRQRRLVLRRHPRRHHRFFGGGGRLRLRRAVCFFLLVVLVVLLLNLQRKLVGVEDGFQGIVVGPEELQGLGDRGHARGRRPHLLDEVVQGQPLDTRIALLEPLHRKLETLNKRLVLRTQLLLLLLLRRRILVLL